MTLRIKDPVGLADALQRLRGSTSYIRLSERISRETEGRLDLDPTGLQRLATGQFGSIRAVDTPTEAMLLGLGMMLNGLDEHQAPDEVIRHGKLVLLHLLDLPWASLAFAEIESRAQQITHIKTLREFLRECIRQWLQ
jgi:hypothetical protein